MAGELIMPTWATSRLGTRCEEQAKRNKRSLQLAEKADEQERGGDRFVKQKKPDAEQNPALGYRSPLERAQQAAESLRKKNVMAAGRAQ